MRSRDRYVTWQKHGGHQLTLSRRASWVIEHTFAMNTRLLVLFTSVLPIISVYILLLYTNQAVQERLLFTFLFLDISSEHKPCINRAQFNYYM